MKSKSIIGQLKDIYLPIENVISPNDQQYTAMPIIRKGNAKMGIHAEFLTLENGVEVLVNSFSPVFFNKSYVVIYKRVGHK